MPTQKETVSEPFDIKEFIQEALAYKYFYLASFIVCITAAFLLNKFSPVIYQVNSIIGPVDDKRSSLMGSNDLFTDLGGMAESRNLENDINSLKSFSLVATTLTNMDLEVGYYSEMNNLLRRTRQTYPGYPYLVSIDKSHNQPVDAKFYIDILDRDSYRLTCSENEISLYNYLDDNMADLISGLKIDTICRFNETVNNKYFKFSISLDKDFVPKKSLEGAINYFEFYYLDALAMQYLGRINVTPVNIKSSLINVSFEGKNLELTIDFLNKYLQTYLDDNLSKKNKISLNTVNFIDSQISDISDSLLRSESKLRDYRSANLVTDLSYQGQKALEQMTQIENERSTLQVQERYYNYILDYFNKNQDMSGLAPPSTANVIDPIMNSLVLELLNLNSQRSTIMSNNAEKNLFLGQLDNKIKLQKQTIIENVKNNLNTLNITQNELNYRSDKVSKEISRLPRTELNMVSMQRKFNLSDAIYTFMLQKRSESAITMASNYPDYEILEPARGITGMLLSPKKMLNWLIGLFLGLMIPTIYIILKNFFNEKMTSVKDAEILLKRTVLNVIYTNNYKTESVVKESPGSSIAESFRNLRSSLFLKFRSTPFKVIMITSAQPWEGKSFIAFNLASSIANVGYKTVIIDCDLRRPTLHNKFKVDNSTGLSNYMVDHTSIDEIIQDSDIEKLSFIPAGPTLPNSSELIEAGVLDDLIEILKSQFDYIIIDSTPAGIVADATPILKYADHILLVSRNNVTRKDLFNDVLTMFNTNNIENFDVVFNDLNMKKSRYGRYDTYYKKN